MSFFVKKAFSLLSVVTALAIAMIIISFSSYSTIFVRKALDRFRCSSNLRQIYTYWMMYLDEHHDRSASFEKLDNVGGQSLKKVLEDFLSRQKGYAIDLTDLFICPADHFHSSFDLRKNGSYDYRDEMMGKKKSLIFSHISHPQEKILMGDYRSGWHDFSFFSGNRLRKKSSPKINVLFADGHVEYISEEKWEKNLKMTF